MADRKRRPPSSKVKPGTPHPTKAYTVRGYDGRWISTKAFNAAKRAKEKATQKGGALVKRTTSAVTKVANKAGDLLKIKKGDKGIVRAVKDVHKLGKDTRKSANALYKAGKITREVHDKLVKGGKDFVGGVKEAGKATRRAYEKTKPGGKIVRVSKDAPKFKFEALPKKKGGAIVKTKGSAVTKANSTKGGKLTTTRKPTYLKDTLDKKAKQNAATKAANAKKAARRDAAEMKLTRAKKGSGPTLGKKPTVGQPVNQLNRAKRFVSKNAPKAVKGVKTGGKWLSKQAARTGVAGKVAGRALILKDLVDESSDIVRGVGNIYRRSQNKPLLKRLNIGGYKAGKGITDKLVDKHNARLKAKKSKPNDKPNNQVQNDTKKTQNNNQSWEVKSKPKNNTKLTSKDRDDIRKEKELSNLKIKDQSNKSNKPNTYFDAPITYKESDHTTPKSTKKYTARDRMRIRNEAIHGKPRNDKVYNYNKEWQAARKAGTLKDFKKKYPSLRAYKWPK
tara:strand:- start:13 stop:1527 length:1515 start_codon:yes stop_codon:yes gene_type:complete